MTTQNSQEGNAGSQIVFTYNVKLLLWTLWKFVGFMRLIRRIKVRGVENLKTTPWENRLVLFNHPSFLEIILIPLTGFMPGMLTTPETRFPWSVANERTILSSKSAFLKNLPIVLLKTDEKGRPIDSMAFLKQVLPKMKETTFLIAPEGTRSFHADEPRIITPSGVTIGRARDGIGFLIWHAKPTVIPVLVKGMELVMPPDKPMWHFIFKIWKHPVEIVFGKPLDLSQFFEEKQSRGVYTNIGKYVMKAIADLDTSKRRGPNQ